MKLGEIECQFRWKPESESAKKIKDMIETLREKFESLAAKAIMQRTTLSYMYTLEGHQDFPKSRKELDKLKDVDIKQTEDKLARDFLLKAISIRINQ